MKREFEEKKKKLKIQKEKALIEKYGEQVQLPKYF